MQCRLGTSQYVYFHSEDSGWYILYENAWKIFSKVYHSLSHIAASCYIRSGMRQLSLYKKGWPVPYIYLKIKKACPTKTDYIVLPNHSLPRAFHSPMPFAYQNMFEEAALDIEYIKKITNGYSGSIWKDLAQAYRTWMLTPNPGWLSTKRQPPQHTYRKIKKACLAHDNESVSSFQIHPNPGLS